jgi:hypothetical protein
MSSIEKTSAGTWRARYRDPQGRSRRETFRRKGDAQRFLENAGVDMQRGSWVDPQLGRVRLAEWVEEWWTTAVHLRPSTRSQYERDLRLHLLPRFGAQPLATITPREVRAWVAEMVAAGVPPSGVNRRLRLFSRLMNAAVENELLARSPAKGVRAPQAARKETRFLTAAEVRDLAEAINPWFRVWVYFAAYTGIRWSEMLGLRRKDIDLLRRTVTVERQLLEVQSRFLGVARAGCPSCATASSTAPWQRPGPPRTRTKRRSGRRCSAGAPTRRREGGRSDELKVGSLDERLRLKLGSLEAGRANRTQARPCRPRSRKGPRLPYLQPAADGARRTTSQSRLP